MVSAVCFSSTQQHTASNKAGHYSPVCISLLRRHVSLSLLSFRSCLDTECRQDNLIQTNFWTSAKFKAPFQVLKKEKNIKGNRKTILKVGVTKMERVYPWTASPARVIIFFSPRKWEWKRFCSVQTTCNNKLNTFHKEHFSYSQRSLAFWRSESSTNLWK